MPNSQQRDPAPMSDLRREAPGRVERMLCEVKGPGKGQGGLPVPTADLRSSLNYTPQHRYHHRYSCPTQLRFYE
ncbi:hypothetical protein N657DRAFT_651755 [Parathielavia appendiculata]|uniref:Uncharacterized protein n=1 Tax=Parathielavia appendiculata TaxID=2587402 RepID=A0AAN6TNY1_9PEZI|nr:hypothetical protein N657DRAFT_651755 [Parathielavia appendiculata]